MPKLFLVLLGTILCLSSSFSFGQKSQQKIDSLLQLINRFPKEDHIKVDRLLTISDFSLSTVDPETGLSYAKQALTIAEKINNQILAARAYLHIGNALNLQYKYQEAIAYRQKALVIFEEKKRPENIANTLFNLGNDYFRLNEWVRALDYYLKAYESVKLLNVPMGEFACLAQIANTYSLLGNHKKALDFQFTALKIAEKINDPLSVSVSYTGIGNEYKGLGDLKKALDYYQKSLVIKEKYGELRGQNIVISNIATVYVDLGNKESALEYFEKSLQLGIAMGNKQTQWVAHTGIGGMLLSQFKNDAALSSYIHALQLGEELKDENFIAGALIQLSTINVRRGKFAEAETQLNKADLIFKKLLSLEGQRNTYEKYTEFYEAKKDYNKALESYKNYITARDSIASEEIKAQSAQKEMQYDFDKKENTYLLNAQLAEEKLSRERMFSLQQQQVLLLQKQKLSLSDKEKSLQRLTFLQKQAELENDRKLQAGKFQQAKLQSGYITSLRDKQISKQDQQIRFDFWVKIFLTVAIALALLSVFLIFLNNRKTARLNTIVSTQKSELEHLNMVKDHIFSVVSHDMRAPVNSLISFVQLLEYRAIEQNKLQEYSVQLRNSLSYTSTMMDNLLNWASSQMQGFQPKKELVNVHDLVTRVALSFESTAAQKKIALTNSVPAETMCIADANMFERVVSNLIDNAIKFTPESGSVTIDAVLLQTQFKLTVADTGRGLTSKQVDYFNDPANLGGGESTRGTNREKGTGLGLLLCKTFVELMNGSIRAERAASGSIFTVYFNILS